MDVFSYLLGKNSSGGGSCYDWEAIGYNEPPEILDYYYNEAKEIYDNWDPTITSANSKFESKSIAIFPNVDISNLTSASNMFRYSTIAEIGSFDLPRLNSGEGIFYNCTNLMFINDFMPKRTCNLKNAFYYCKNLKKINKFRITNNSNNLYVITSTTDLVINELLMNGPDGKQIFSSCTNLDIKKIINENNHTYRNNKFCENCTFTNDAMDEILKYFKTLTQQGDNYKILKSLGFSSANCNQAINSPYWQDLVDLGWTTGY